MPFAKPVVAMRPRRHQCSPRTAISEAVTGASNGTSPQFTGPASTPTSRSPCKSGPSAFSTSRQRRMARVLSSMASTPAVIDPFERVGALGVRHVHGDHAGSPGEPSGSYAREVIPHPTALHAKTLLITGATSGFGEATARPRLRRSVRDEAHSVRSARAQPTHTGVRLACNEPDPTCAPSHCSSSRCS